MLGQTDLHKNTSWQRIVKIATLPRFPSVFPFVTCEPSINHCTIAETGRLYE